MLASLGRTCYRHRRTVAGAWVLLSVGLFLVGTQAFGRLGVDYSGSSIESFAGFDRLDEASPYGAQIAAAVDGAGPDAPGMRAAVTAAARTAEAVDGVGRIVTPYDVPAPALRSSDGRAFLVTVELDKGLDLAARDRALTGVEDALRPLAEATDTTVTFGGTPLVHREESAQTRRDTERGEMVALPITLAVMVVLFAGFLAAAIPVIGALVSVSGGLAALYGFSFLLDLDPSVASVTTVMGLGLSIDYSLLLISRFREERARGLDSEAAIAATMTTAGRTITFSALTVAVSLSGLFLFNVVIFRGLAAAGLSVVLVALAAGLTLVPALIGLFARRIKPSTAEVSDDGFFARLARITQRRAVLVVVLVGGLLVAAGLPFLNVSYRLGGAELLPKDFESRQFAELLQARFPDRGTDPVIVVAKVPAQTLASYGARFADRADVAALHPAEQRLAGWSVLELTPAGTSQGDAAQDLVRALRTDRPDYPTWVTGNAAVLVDLQASVRAGLPWAALWVGTATFVLLFLMTGSVLVPLKALVMNTLSLGATFGALVWVFQEGHLSGLLGFTPVSGLETWLPVLVFAFAFGLSMDYEVFLLSRIKECYDAGAPNDRAVQLGLQRSGRIITSAALLIIIVFVGFAAGRTLTIKELGLAMAIAVAVDATLVRCLLVPATMTLLGDLNWWAPRPLRRLHARFGFAEAHAPSAGPPPELR